ncbi:MAG: hypothetical protein KA165_10175 [Saprospiraceae bacterium]|nr:hypothetical protein [Saprospiraceae bacterium]
MQSHPPSLLKTILFSGLLVGTLDIATALIQYSVQTGKDPLDVLRYIACGVFGSSAFTGGVPMAGWGLFFHFVIAFSFTAFFFFIYPKLGVLAKNRVLTGIFYGLFIWIVMNLGVLPLARISYPSHVGRAALGALILICMIGLPLSFIAHRYYRREG